MPLTVNVAGQVKQITLVTSKALWPLFETIINSIQSLEDSNVADKIIQIDAIRSDHAQLMVNGKEELAHFENFVVTDNGNGFNTVNYKSFLEAYTQLKVKKGCKGIGRFLWLKAFEEASVSSKYFENGQWHFREFDFTLAGVLPEQNDKVCTSDDMEQQTIVRLKSFKKPYYESVSYSLESLAKKIIEHCLPYFITGSCPRIILRDSEGESINLNSYYEQTYKDSIHQDMMELKGKQYVLYHMRLTDGVDKHELHLCANSREVKSYQLSSYIPDMKKKLVNGEESYYYVGYLSGEYLDEAVNTERSDFNFSDAPLFDSTNEKEIIGVAVHYIQLYLADELSKIANEKRAQIDMLVKTKRPQYRLLLNRRPEVYEKIPAGLAEDKLDVELYKMQQQWELDTARRKHDIEARVKQDATTDPGFQKLFDEYCENITDLSRASLAEYVAHRKAVLDLFEQALEVDASGKYSKESRIHSIICPMQTTSDEVKFDDMNLWLIDERLAYHQFLASDKKINSISILDSNVDKRMDLAIFDAALSYTADPNDINSITIVELKRPQRNDLATENTDPITQVYDYVTDIKEGKVRKANGRGFGNVQQIAFYCYVIADITPSLEKSAKRAGLVMTQDNEGYFGYNSAIGTYIEVISYDKLLKDAKQRNRVLFDKLFEPKLDGLKHPEVLDH